jgi:hypothetical protein
VKWKLDLDPTKGRFWREAVDGSQPVSLSSIAMRQAAESAVRSIARIGCCVSPI